ncbi:3-keto-5-aminohexanoate cleavage protein [Streptomyces abyssomicinicus]|uniref:3-keto-5-aminohexanoate cleavage protein n=1 Tax=Streptomyces abyssomicinicus TaxID=574929 RepID=UPI00125017E5|nr:3-keto-5-aminohexanoate cleavage protein [Streptomyces abyssomicinicus]
MLQACLNGTRRPDESRWVAVTAAELAAEARRAVDAGAEDIHLHPRDHHGHDTLDAVVVHDVLQAVREAVGPGVRVGVTTGEWIERDPARRARLVESWTTLPDHASVNWHEEGADRIARALTERGIGIEAGLFSGTGGPDAYLSSPFADRVLRVLVEITRTPAARAAREARGMAGRLSAATSAPVLLHGDEDSAWTVLETAAELGLDTRIGLEDALTLPDGTPAEGNAALVTAALEILRRDRNPAGG